MASILTVEQFARCVGLEPATVYIAIKQDRVRHTRVLGRLGIPATELQKFEPRPNGKKTKVLRRR